MNYGSFKKRYRQIFVLFTSFFVSALALHAQENENPVGPPKVVPPSPNAAALGKYGDIPVSPYAGVPNISIPIYEIQSGDIKVPISISYHASGVKVAEEASRVGLGWALNAGGVITRTVIGKDDFKSLHYIDTDVPELPQVSSAFPTLIQEGCQIAFPSGAMNLENYIGRSDPYDFEPDHYSYNFLGHTGKFILRRNREVVLQNLDKVLIKLVGEDEHTFHFEVKTPDGFTYLFDTVETHRATGEAGGFGDGISAWYLTKITSPSGEEVSFNYIKEPSQLIHPAGSFYEAIEYNTLSTPTVPCQQIQNFTWGATPSKYYTNVYLSAITFKHDSINFNYTAREDLYGDKMLSHISIPRLNKEFLFSYSYFIGSIDKDFITDSEDYVEKRLKLDSLTENVTINGAVTSKEPYKFNYYEGGNRTLPAKTSFARDHWGYYNGQHGNTSLIPTHTYLNGSSNEFDYYTGVITGKERNTDLFFLKDFSLKEIVYPTKGRTEFQYEAHDFDPALSVIKDQSYFAKKQPNPTKETNTWLMYNMNERGTVQTDTLDLTNELTDISGAFPAVELTAGFRFNTEADGTCQIPPIPGDDLYFELYKIYLENGEEKVATSPLSRVDFGLRSPDCTASSHEPCIYLKSDEGQCIFEYKNTYSLPPGKYLWKAYVSATNSAALKLQDMSTNYKWIEEIKQSASTYAGGLRILKIIDHDAIDESKNKIRRFVYNYKADKDSNGVEESYSFGRRMTMPQYSYAERSIQENVVITSTGSHEIVGECWHFIRVSDSNIPLNGSASGSIVGYDQVSLLYGENGEFGKTDFLYENQSDFVLDYSYYPDGHQVPVKPPLFPNIPNKLNGSLIKQIDYAHVPGGYTPVKEVVNLHREINKVLSFAIEKRLPIDYQSSETGFPHCYVYSFLYPTVENSRIYLASTTEKIFDRNDPDKFLETSIIYRYDNPDHLQLTSTSISTSVSDEVLVTTYKYPADYADGEADAALKEMKSDGRYMHGAMIERTNKRSAAGQEKILSRNINRYGYFAGKDGHQNILPKSKILLENTKPLLPGELPEYNFLSVNDTDFYKTRFIFSRYDTKGNILQYKAADGQIVSFIWGYHQSLPVAKIVNATVTEIEEVLGAGLSLGASGLSEQQESVLRSNLTLSQVYTYKYVPLVGVVQIKDPTGNSTHYRYDQFNRLEHVLDANQNILQQYEYKYASE